MAKPIPTPNELPTTVLRVSHHNAKHIAERWPYAAYGSNLSLVQMADRCKSPEPVVRATLPNHRLIFARFASIEAAKGSDVPVGVYRLDADDVERLDRREGLGRSYDRFLVTVLAEDGRAIRCFTYVKRDSRLQPPSEKYYQRILEGYRDWNFETRRLRHARKAASKNYDANKSKYEAEAATMWHDWYNGRGEQQSLPFGNVDRRGQAKVRTANDDSQFSLVTGRCRKCHKTHEGVVCPSVEPKYLAVSFQSVEFGQRGDELFFRVKNTRAWYADRTSPEDVKSGLVRGELAVTLPGSQAFIPKEP